MDLNNFINSIEGLFDEITPGSIKSDTKFKELPEWDSMLALSLITMVDSEYGISLSGTDIKKSETIEELYKIITSK